MLIFSRALKCLSLVMVVFALSAPQARSEDPWVVYEGFPGPGKGKHIVLVSGDDEYRSEEALPQLGKILAKHHGFKCTVLFAVHPDTGLITPSYQRNIPGLESLKKADLMVMALRFRDLPDEQMKHIDDYVKAGKPIVGMRTSTHAFNLRQSKTYAKYDFRSRVENWKDGFGRQILGETWINHHGHHGRESTGGLIAKGMEKHPILRGIRDRDVWGPTDVYGVRLPLPEGCKPLIMGLVLRGMKADDEPVEGKKNDPMMPVAWIKHYEGANGAKGRVFTTTMGASQDLLTEGTRRMLVNACYWALGMEEKIPAKSNVDIVGEYKPSRFSFGGFKKGVKPSDHAMK